MTNTSVARRGGGARTLLVIGAVVAAASAPVPVRAQAARVNVSPTALSMARRDVSGTVTLRNTGDEAVDFQASVHHWSSGPGGAIVLDDTADLLVAPSVFRLEPGGSRRVRVLARTAAGDRERTYRLVLSQLPDASQQTRGGVAMRMELSVPVFVPPVRRAAGAHVATASIAAGRVSLDLRNSGNATIGPQQLTVRVLDAAHVPLGIVPVALWYLLPGDARTLAVALPAGTCRRAAHVEVDLGVDTRRTTLQAGLREDGAACAP